VSALEFRGQHLQFMHDTTAAIDLEGSLASGKTSACLCKELRMLKRHPGMHALIARWTDDATNLLLRPALEQMARIEDFPIHWTDDKKKYYECENGSRIYCFGLKTQSQEPEQRYGKIRGLPVSRIYIDQAEQLPGDVASELLLRLRPDLEQKQLGQDFPRQLTFSPNPPNTDSWLAKQFPSDNRIRQRKYYALSIWDNAHNLPDGFIDNALINYPVEHPKHQTVILGQRGPNISGDPVYENIFDRKTHAIDPLEPVPGLGLIEAFEVGQHNPAWVIGQRTFHGGLHLLGGILAKRMMLEDFLPIVRAYRDEWFPDIKTRTCTSPMGEQVVGDRYTLLKMLQDAGYRPVYWPNANAHDVQLATIEQIGSLLRRRTLTHEEAFKLAATPMRWLYVEPTGSAMQKPFLSFAFDGGYVWDPHTVSVANKDLRQPLVDGEYSTAMRCVENLVLNFCAGHPTESERQRRRTEGGPRRSATPNVRGWMV
jgi:hypothetical protein